ncbi:MAG: DUF3499 family protein [Actinobacteria bacterium]|nr:DUF3499 family protein [Actinomycetota bacterium]
MRTCAKMRCESRAAATVALRYEAREVVISDLAPEPNPNLLDLCAEHAERLTPPVGWRVRDERLPVPAPSS